MLSRIVVCRTLRLRLWCYSCNFSRDFSRNSYIYDQQSVTLSEDLIRRIKWAGPITVADYMKDILTNPVSGYYMHKDVFGQKGDFITSPEISPMFGELVGIWCVYEWMQSGSPSNFNLVELGPGRGTLMDDILRVFSKFEDILSVVSVNFVEVSPKLSQLQEKKLCFSVSQEKWSTEACYKSAPSKYGPLIKWYKHLRDVPHAFTCFIAHEFFDALPIHKFQKKDGSWHEVFIDYNEDAAKFEFVLAKGPTPRNLLLEIDSKDTREHIEICPEAGIWMQEIAKRIQNNGGYALIADYGYEGTKEDTFRAYKDHKLHNPLLDPGTADLTADVDFSYIRRMVTSKFKMVTICGPISQQQFLHNMGIELRMQVLMQHADEEIRRNIITSYNMLTNPDEMGERFKFFSLHKHSKDYLPAGFILPT